MSWDQITNSSASSESLFIRLDEQRTQVRVVGDPVVYARHWTKGQAGENCTVKCSDYGNVARKSCPVCAIGGVDNKARIRAIFPVIDRRTQSVKLLDLPQTVAAQLKSLMSNPDWGSPLHYDITIQKSKMAKRVDYQILPASTKTPLTNDENAMVADFFSKVDYRTYAVPHTPEEIMAILNGRPLQKQAQQNYGNNAPAYQAPMSYAPQAPAPLQAQYAPAPVQQQYAPQAPVYQYVAPAPVYAAPAAPIAPVYAVPVAPVAPAPVYAPAVAPVYAAPVAPVQPVQSQAPGNAIGDDLLRQFAPQPPKF